MNSSRLVIKAIQKLFLAFVKNHLLNKFSPTEVRLNCLTGFEHN